MSNFSKVSEEKLATCHPDLQRLFHEVIKQYDCIILCGHRNEIDQNKAFEKGASKLKWPNSKHNSTPSLAVDAAPFPLDWQDSSRFYHFIGFVFATANFLNIKIRSGADWNGNLKFSDEKLLDLPHFELMEDS